MKPDSPHNSEEPMETQLTALLLGELSAADAAAVQAAMRENGSLAELHRQLQQTIGLVREVAASPGPENTAAPGTLQLSAERRRRLQTAFKVTPAPGQSRDWTWFIPMSIAAILMALIGSVLLLPAISQRNRRYLTLSSARSETLPPIELSLSDRQDARAASAPVPSAQTPTPFVAPGAVASSRTAELRPETIRRLERDTQAAPVNRNYFQEQLGVEGRAASDAYSKGTAEPKPAFSTNGGGFGGGGFGRTEVAKSGAGNQPNGSESAAPQSFGFGAGVTAFFADGGAAPGNQPAKPTIQLWTDLDKDSALNDRIENEGLAVAKSGTTQADLDALNRQANLAVAGGRDRLGEDVARAPVLGDTPGLGWAFRTESKMGAQGGTDPTIALPPASRPHLETAANAIQDSELQQRFEHGTKEQSLGRSDAPVNSTVQAASAAERNPVKLKAAMVEQQPKALGNRSKELGEMKSGLEERGEQVQREEQLALKRENEQADKKTSEQALVAVTPQPEVETSTNPISTFSLNVSDVSFNLAAASLDRGQMPDPATVRSEEFINAFDYRDPEPAAGVPIGFAWERARYPFAQDRDLVRFSVKTAAVGRPAGAPLNLVLLLDRSGSMERADRVRIVEEALRVLAGQLQPQDKLSVITFARTARLWADGLAGNQVEPVLEQVAHSTPEGGTNLEEALNLAYQTALKHHLERGGNRVVLLTDGAANLGNVNPDALKRKVESYRKQGVALDCFGIGWEGFDDEVLETLSRNGDGRYRFLNTLEEAAHGFAQQLAGAFHAAAADVKVQVEFNPKRVTVYRQMGYAKHQLRKEQFRDNTVDAAELAAAESGNALYTVQVRAAGEGPIATVRVRYKVPETGEYREQEWTVPYTGQVGPLEQASPSLRLAGTAGAFAEWLAASPFAAEVNPDRLNGCLTGVPQSYGSDPRPRKLEAMIQQAKSMGKP